ncbi:MULTISPECIES: class I SAM-dependent methyltransferase [Paraburkholderia]|uniref:class I SAM-dependent methyltransferase n=1 Tax=Paraburkholderia TaxID=1822464 RepID=UPI0004248C68|nr:MULTISPECIES: class I SAM-dependent methyltransferase [Paraburkholderia]
MTQPFSAADPDDDYQQLATEQALATERLIAELGFSAGTRVLDIACGTGHAALAAARRRAQVTAVDIDETSLARARRRAEAEALDGIDFQSADARAIPFADGSFDVALSTLGLVFLPDQEAAACELARVVRPGGVIALTAYTAQSIPAQVYEMVQELVKPPGRPEHPHYAWSHGPRAGALLNPWFDLVRVRYQSTDTCFPSAAASFGHVSRWNPNIRGLLTRLTAPQRQTFREGYITILERHNRATDGTFIASMDYAVITGVRKA